MENKREVNKEEMEKVNGGTAKTMEASGYTCPICQSTDTVVKYLYSDNRLGIHCNKCGTEWTVRW